MTKIIFAVTGAAMILTTPALAAQSRHSGIAPSTGPTFPHVIVQGRDVGTDPSGLVRLDLTRDPFGGQ
jgi:hypothetical protein